MALVVFLRGVNVGGHRTFRPKQLAEQLKHLDAINIGAAGTFVIRKRIAVSKVRAELARRLPFVTHIAICEGREILRLVDAAPHGPDPAGTDITRFISILLGPPKAVPATPVQWPPKGQWLVKIHAVRGRFIVGEYRRNMKTISYLGGLDKAFGQPTTTRNWNTFCTIAKTLSI